MSAQRLSRSVQPPIANFLDNPAFKGIFANPKAEMEAMTKQVMLVQRFVHKSSPKHQKSVHDANFVRRVMADCV